MLHLGTYVTIVMGTDHFRGWLIAVNETGFYLTDDREGVKVRFVPAAGDWAVRTHDEVPRSQLFSDRAQKRLAAELEQEITYSMERALDETEFSSLRASAKVLKHGESERAVAGAYRRLFNELSRSRILGILEAYDEKIRRVLSFDTLPAQDANVGITELVKRVRQAKASRATITLTEDELSVLSRLEHAGQTATNKRKKQDAKLLHGINELAFGGSFAATNAIFGASVGIVSALPSLGIGTVAAAVGIATSMFTGLKTANDGLRDIWTWDAD